MMITPDQLLDLKQLIYRAGDAIMSIYADQSLWETQQKSNDTPVTAADLAAQEVLIKGLSSLTPNLPILSEEGLMADWQIRQHWSRYWLLDPLDGTREFLQRNGEFTVNIALIDQGRAALGLVYAPATETLYWGSDGTQLKPKGAWKTHRHGEAEKIQVKPSSSECTLLTSRRHSQHETQALQRLIDEGIYTSMKSLSMGSSLKFCHIAEGKADLYLRLAPTSEWDTAAAQVVLEAAGGCILTLPEAIPMRYNEKEDINNPSFIAMAQPIPDWVSTLID
ncbi:3'(2'),5'-bisphosphate nucleotidase CysQ [Nitrincola schmidtii]|uniref:3'(2'),5'-bisphosphate nucleotidase CysQ n=1 Tax=Nitrincola schmidtii TaxID=1730894 RepID=UPI001F103CB2|nr:3'(2'),5'-bisphosphate nucleotidase CysQ [Nitrincola schmidtii]